jgi:hypothetical protein
MDPPLHPYIRNIENVLNACLHLQIQPGTCYSYIYYATI